MTKPDLQKHINEEVKTDINRLYDHAEVANKEVGTIKTDIAIMKTEFQLMRGMVKAVNSKQWAIIAIILAAAMGVLFKK